MRGRRAHLALEKASVQPDDELWHCTGGSRSVPSGSSRERSGHAARTMRSSSPSTNASRCWGPGSALGLSGRLGGVREAFWPGHDASHAWQHWQTDPVGAHLRVAVVGLLTGAAAAILSEIVGTLVLIAGAMLAGWLLSSEPMKAAALFVLPAALAGAVRIILDDASDVLPALLIGVLLALVLAAIFAHVGAGIALRRQNR